MTGAEFVSRLGPDANPVKTASGWQCLCPSHEDRVPSLSVTEKTDRILIHCHAGCTLDAICAALNIKPADLFFTNGTHNKPAERRIVTAYDYQDATGKLLFQVVRFEPKTFRQRRPNTTAKDGWTRSTKGIEKVLFRLPEALRAIRAGKPIFVCEGEKDCLAMAAHGLQATCNPGGAGKWQGSYTETLRGADVVVIADKDKAGREHAQLVAGKLHGVAKSVRVIELPDLGGKLVKDAHDFFTAGGSAADLMKLAQATREWEPPSVVTAPAVGCDFDAVTAWVRGEILAVLLNEDTPPTTKRNAIAGLVVEALEKLGRFFFHADLRDFETAMYFDVRRKRLELVRSDAFAAQLSEWLRINRADPIFRFILAAVETTALSGPRTSGIQPESYWAARTGAFYISAGDGSAAKITPGQVGLVDNGTDGILFSAGRTLQRWTLAEPRDPFETCAILRNAHCTAGHALDLLRLWLYSLPTAPRSKPPLCLAGDVGAGKTRTAKAFAELYGLPFVAAKVEESEENNFWPACDQGGIYTLDNADSKCRWLADAVANAATDGCSQRRKLYTNAETVTLRARAWIVLTTANPTFASDSGLADRLLLVRMARREAAESSDSALTDEILANRDAALSHIAHTLATALGDTGPVPAGLNQRHPDFAAFAVRIGRALGREPEAVSALKAAEFDKAAFCLENDAIASALLAYLKTAGTFTGTAAELVPHLCEVDADLRERLSAKRLGKRLSALWPHVQKSLAVARKNLDRNGVSVFNLGSAVDDSQASDKPEPVEPEREPVTATAEETLL